MEVLYAHGTNYSNSVAIARLADSSASGEEEAQSRESERTLIAAPREQHIRRAKATSNICTNSALCALGAAVYLATMGNRGLQRVAQLCFHKSHYAATEIGKLAGFAINPQAPAQPFFKEFVVRLPGPAPEINARLRERHGIIGGYDLGRDYAHLQNHMLIVVTELNTRAGIDRLVAALGEAAR